MSPLVTFSTRNSGRIASRSAQTNNSEIVRPGVVLWHSQSNVMALEFNASSKGLSHIHNGERRRVQLETAKHNLGSNLPGGGGLKDATISFVHFGMEGSLRQD